MIQSIWSNRNAIHRVFALCYHQEKGGRGYVYPYTKPLHVAIICKAPVDGDFYCQVRDCMEVLHSKTNAHRHVRTHTGYEVSRPLGVPCLDQNKAGHRYLFIAIPRLRCILFLI